LQSKIRDSFECVGIAAGEGGRDARPGDKVARTGTLRTAQMKPYAAAPNSAQVAASAKTNTC
jgi:hypothetical protein